MANKFLNDPTLNFMRKQGYPVPSSSLLLKDDEVPKLRKACRLTKSILDDLNDVIKPGITTDDVNTWVHNTIISHGAIPATLNYKGYPKSCCTSLNHVVCHGIPDGTVLKDGDILNVDVTSILDGYYGDSCRMYLVGDVSPEARKLVEVTKECLDLAIAQVKPLNTLNDSARAIENHAKKNGYSIVEMFGGHGIGKKFHQDPFVYHYVRPEKQMVYVPNMTFTIEPMINIGVSDCKILSDQWTAVTADGSLSAQWEHTLCVTESGVEVLTA